MNIKFNTIFNVLYIVKIYHPETNWTFFFPKFVHQLICLIVHRFKVTRYMSSEGDFHWINLLEIEIQDERKKAQQCMKNDIRWLSGQWWSCSNRLPSALLSMRPTNTWKHRECFWHRILLHATKISIVSFLLSIANAKHEIKKAR